MEWVQAEMRFTKDGVERLGAARLRGEINPDPRWRLQEEHPQSLILNTL